MIRRYIPSDLDECASVFKNAFSAPPWNEEWSMELAKIRIEELLSAPASIGYVYEENSCIIGFVAGRKTTYLHGIEYFIDEFCISPDTQGQGIGSKMIDCISHELKELGFVDIVLNTVRDFPAEKFYLKNGFVRKDDMIFMYLNF